MRGSASLRRAAIAAAGTAAGAAFALLLAAGCGTKLNEDYELGTGDYHPFVDTGEHGAWLAANAHDFSTCTNCHGETLHGQVVGADGTVVRSCYACHTAEAHQVGFADAEEEHAAYLRSVYWDLGQCFVCHPEPAGLRGAPRAAALRASPDFGGSCNAEGCHDAANGGPVACNVCHGDWEGDAADPLAWAPPEDLEGVDTPTTPGVGAHQTHLGAPNEFSAAVPCETCHLVPAKWNDAGHLDDTPTAADVTFGGIAGGPAWYDFATSTCTDTYCHRNKTPVWTEVDGTWNECGACHGLPPTGGHSQGPGVENCDNCHGEVIEDVIGDVYLFLAPELHINGEVEED